MDKKELFDSIDYALIHALANTHTATIGRVENVRDTTIDVRPVINRVVDGESRRLPLFVKVPPVFLYGGSSYTAHPIVAGDYALLVFTERCFDRWYAGQDFQSPLELRMHDYSDGFAIVGIKNQAGAITIPDVITHIGDAYQQGDYIHDGNRNQTGEFDLTGDLIHQGAQTHVGNTTQSGNNTVSGRMEFGSSRTGGLDGVSGSFTSNDGKTITVTNGIVTGIV